MRPEERQHHPAAGEADYAERHHRAEEQEHDHHPYRHQAPEQRLAVRNDDGRDGVDEPPRWLQGGEAAVDDLGRVGEGRRLLVYPGACGPPTLPRREKVPGVDPELLGVFPSHAFRKIPRPLPETVQTFPPVRQSDTASILHGAA